ncbi:MAG: hypothetical protein Q4B73_02790 [Lachnospiraceae bacterium]|nr:hypothetical protein [Lachnospiraceae bacterium]
MAARRRVNTQRDYRYMPVDGTTARQAVAYPREEERRRKKRVSSQTRENRARALSMNRSFVVFLTVAAVVCVLMCVYYLQARALLTAQIDSNAKLESRLTKLQSENDALYETISNNVDLDHVRDVAINDLGMTYATEDQIIWYNTEGSGYMRQYQEVPTGN